MEKGREVGVSLRGEAVARKGRQPSRGGGLCYWLKVAGRQVAGAGTQGRQVYTVPDSD